MDPNYSDPPFRQSNGKADAETLDFYVFQGSGRQNGSSRPVFPAAARGNMSVSFAVLLALSAAAPPPPDSAMLRHTRNAIIGLNSGRALTLLSLWTVPVVYDIGILTMMGSKKTLKNEYRRRYNEDPEDYEQSGDNAFWQGWAMKGCAVVSMYVVNRLTEDSILPIFSFAVLWLGGTFKHYEASRMLYEQSRHYENGIRDESPPVSGRMPAGSGEAFKLRLALDF
jgi:hypothetical protein